MKRIVKKAEVRRAEIIEAAVRLFRSKGRESVTMQEIMDELGIAKGTIYHYFRSKEDLLEAIVGDLVEKELAAKEALLRGPEAAGLDALGRMRALTGGPSLADENEKVLETLHGEEHAAMHARQLGRYIKRLAPLFAEVIEQGRREGVFTTETPLESAEFMLAGAQFITDAGFYPWSAADLGRRAAALPALIENQLGAPAGSFGFLKKD